MHSSIHVLLDKGYRIPIFRAFFKDGTIEAIPTNTGGADKQSRRHAASSSSLYRRLATNTSCRYLLNNSLQSRRSLNWENKNSTLKFTISNQNSIGSTRLNQGSDISLQQRLFVVVLSDFYRELHF